MPNIKKLEEFAQLVASMILNGENDANGDTFEQGFDDAFDALQNLIVTARDVVASKPERVRVLATDSSVIVTVGRTFVKRVDTPAMFSGSELSEILDELNIQHTYKYKEQ